MAKVDNADRFGRHSRLRFYRLTTDKNANRRIGLRDRTTIEQMKKLQYKVYAVPSKFEFRPDLISLEQYGTPKLWWIIVGVNGITHPFKEMNTNTYLRIPDSDQVFALLS